jgi:hypothetical protein
MVTGGCIVLPRKVLFCNTVEYGVEEYPADKHIVWILLSWLQRWAIRSFRLFNIIGRPWFTLIEISMKQIQYGPRCQGSGKCNHSTRRRWQWKTSFSFTAASQIQLPSLPHLPPIFKRRCQHERSNRAPLTPYFFLTPGLIPIYGLTTCTWSILTNSRRHVRRHAHTPSIVRSITTPSEIAKLKFVLIIWM